MPGSPPRRTGRPAVHLFLDESGTSASDPMTLIGATAFYDVAAAEATITRVFERTLGDTTAWADPTKRQRFAETGFHFTQDSETVRGAFLDALAPVGFRAYAAFAKNDASVSVADRLTAMYGTLLQSVLARYRDCDITVVFEQNSEMDAIYGRMWSVLKGSVPGIESAEAYRGAKNAPCLSVTDYVLGVTRVHLSGVAHDFQTRRFVELGRSFAYLIDFDDDRHLGGSKHPIL